MSVEQAREFYSIVRSKFAYLETDDGPNPDFSIMGNFYESIFRRSYPFWRGCGYSNVFVNLELQWDSYDNLFSLTLTTRKRFSESETSQVVHLGEVLAVMNADWPSDWRQFDANEGVAQVTMYAAAARHRAREIFIPRNREARGFDGFSWYADVLSRRIQK